MDRMRVVVFCTEADVNRQASELARQAVQR